jgi:hypothetical protein
VYGNLSTWTVKTITNSMKFRALLLIALLGAGLVAAEESVVEKAAKVEEGLVDKAIKLDEATETSEKATPASLTYVDWTKTLYGSAFGSVPDEAKGSYVYVLNVNSLIFSCQ